jgi:phosphoglycolate phosphatase-like HAD superfamily hydrolase
MASSQLKIFFDLDGTLIDVSLRHHRVYSEIVTALNGKPLDKDTYWELKRAKTAWPELLQKSGLSPDVLPVFLERFIATIEQPEYLRADTLFPDALATVKHLATRHACYLVSLRRNHQNLLLEIQWLGLTKHFKKILTGHSETDGSDKKAELIAGELQPDESAIIVGDTEADIKTGQQLGLTTVALLSGIRSKDFLAALNPDHILQSVEELVSLPTLQ